MGSVGAVPRVRKVTRKPAAKKTPPSKPGRYTAPEPRTKKHSPMWVPSVMFTCLATGVVVIIGNYLQLLPGGEAQNSYLFLGLGLLIAGFVLSTQFR